MKTFTCQRLPARRVPFVRRLGPEPDCARAWDRRVTALGKAGILGGDTRFIGTPHDHPEVTPPRRVRHDAGLKVEAEFEPAGSIGAQTIRGDTCAVATHFVPCAKLEAACAQLPGQRLPRRGRPLASTPCSEVRLNDPNATDPADLTTDLPAPPEPPPWTSHA